MYLRWSFALRRGVPIRRYDISAWSFLWLFFCGWVAPQVGYLILVWAGRVPDLCLRRNCSYQIQKGCFAPHNLKYLLIPNQFFATPTSVFDIVPSIGFLMATLIVYLMASLLTVGFGFPLVVALQRQHFHLLWLASNTSIMKVTQQRSWRDGKGKLFLCRQHFFFCSTISSRQPMVNHNTCLILLAHCQYRSK